MFIGQLLIEDTEINLRDKSAINELLTALKAIYVHPEYNSRVFELLESHLVGDKKKPVATV